MKRTFFCLCLLLLISTNAGAQVNPIQCNPFATPVTLHTANTSGVVADFNMSCTAGRVGGGVSNMDFQFFLFVPEIDTGSWTLTQGANTYSGTLVGTQDVRFPSVAFDTSLPTLDFEMSGVTVNPSLFGPGFTYLEAIAVDGPIALDIQDPTLVVAFNDQSPEPATFPLAAAVLGFGSLLARRSHRVA